MTKIGLPDIKLDPEKMRNANLPDGGFGLSGIKQFKDIIENIRLLIGEAKELQNPTSAEPQPFNSPQPLPSQQVSGISKEQLFSFGKQLLDNLIKQGYGNKTVSQTIGDIPLTIKQIRGMMK